MNKYRNVKTTVGGITFDSRAEAKRWQDLLLLQRAGYISDLQRQVAIVLAPSVKFDGVKRAQPALRLVVDFSYTERGGAKILEDVKSVATMTPAFRIKRHLLATHGLQVRVTT